MLKLRGVTISLAQAALLLLPATSWCWTGDTWASMSRTDIENIAKSMVDPSWTTTGFTNYISPGSGNYYFSAGTYKGVAYTQNDPQENWAEFASKINTNNNGNDCSGFVSMCWKLPFRWSTPDFEGGAANGSPYVVKLGNIGDCGIAPLIRGDACVKGDSHIVLFDAYSGTGGMTTMEQTPYTARRGRYWSWSALAAYRPIRRQNLANSGLPTYTLDNANAGFSASANWSTGTSSADKYGTNYRYRSTAAISDGASWSINVGTAGTYRIQAWWSQGTNRSSNIAYKLPNGTNVYVNQQANGGKWNDLGSVTLGTGAQVTTLSCWATTGFVAVADAIRYTP